MASQPPTSETPTIDMVIPQDPVIGSFLIHYVERGDSQAILHIADSVDVTRPGFLVSVKVDRQQAIFSHTMEEPGFKAYVSERLRVYRLKDATLVGADGILLHGREVMLDSLRHIMNWHPDSVVESYTSCQALRLKQAITPHDATDPALHMIGYTGSWRNYAHWLQETLPKLVVFAEHFASGGHVKLVLPHFPPGSFQWQTVELLGIPESAITRIGNTEALHFATALVMSATDLWNVPPYVYEAAQYLAARAAARGHGPNRVGRRLFIHRGTGLRQLANFESLRGIIQRHGYEIFMPDELSLAEQIMAMSAATHVVAEHGAGLANILFCRHGCKVMELFNPACVQPAFWSVAGVSGLQFGYLVGEHVPTPERPELDWNSAYSIAPEMLDAALSALS